MAAVEIISKENVKFSTRHARQTGTVFMVKRDGENYQFEVFIPKLDADEKDLQAYLDAQ